MVNFVYDIGFVYEITFFIYEGKRTSTNLSKLVYVLLLFMYKFFVYEKFRAKIFMYDNLDFIN